MSKSTIVHALINLTLNKLDQQELLAFYLALAQGDFPPEQMGVWEKVRSLYIEDPPRLAPATEKILLTELERRVLETQ